LTARSGSPSCHAPVGTGVARYPTGAPAKLARSPQCTRARREIAAQLPGADGMKWPTQQDTRGSAVPPTEWHRWFAWYPVVVMVKGAPTRVWLRYMDDRCFRVSAAREKVHPPPVAGAGRLSGCPPPPAGAPYGLHRTRKLSIMTNRLTRTACAAGYGLAQEAVAPTPQRRAGA
jgi:hypothetical protein